MIVSISFNLTSSKVLAHPLLRDPAGTRRRSAPFLSSLLIFHFGMLLTLAGASPLLYILDVGDELAPLDHEWGESPI